MRVGARQRDLDDLPGADDVAQPGAHHRPADRRDAACCTAACRAPRRWRARSRCCRLVNMPEPERRVDAVSAPDVRRHAPARDDRDGAGLRPAAADRRRADHRARRHHPGADPGPDARAEGKDRRGDRPDHARPRRRRRDGAARGRDVCRPQGRGGAGGGPVRATRAIPTRRGCWTRFRIWARPAAQWGERASGSRRSRAWCRRCARRSTGCIFAPRCPHATERCRREYPPLEEKTAGHMRCLLGSRIAMLAGRG